MDISEQQSDLPWPFPSRSIWGFSTTFILEDTAHIVCIYQHIRKVSMGSQIFPWTFSSILD